MYKITIQKIEVVTKKESEYKTLREPYADEADRFHSRDERKEDPQYGYVSTEKEVEEATNVLSQTVEELDLTEVIKAINKIK